MIPIYITANFARNCATLRLKICFELSNRTNNRSKVRGILPHTANYCMKVHQGQNNRHRKNAVKYRELSKRFLFKRNFLKKCEFGRSLFALLFHNTVFSISSLVKISMISLILSLNLKLYLNSLVYDQNIFGSSLKSSAIFGNLQKKSEYVQQRLCDLHPSFGESSELLGKWLDFFGKPLKTLLSVCLNTINKIIQVCS